MRGIIETINEAKRTSSMSDVELCCEFWDEWSGFYNCRGGLSSNPRAERLLNAIEDRFGIDMGGLEVWYTTLDDIIEKEYNMPQNGIRGYEIKQWATKVRDLAHKIIINNIDLIKKGDINHWNIR